MERVDTDPLAACGKKVHVAGESIQSESEYRRAAMTEPVPLMRVPAHFGGLFPTSPRHSFGMDRFVVC